MPDASSPVDLADLVARKARDLGIETTLIGAYALAAYEYVRGTADIDLGASVTLQQLRELASELAGLGLHAHLELPEDSDVLGGVLRVWEYADDDGAPIDPVEIVNFLNPYRPRLNPAAEAIRHAQAVDGKPALRFPKLEHLIALKLYADSLKDDADIVEVLVRNPGADLEAIRATAKRFGFERIDDLIRLAQARRR